MLTFLAEASEGLDNAALLAIGGLVAERTGVQIKNLIKWFKDRAAKAEAAAQELAKDRAKNEKERTKHGEITQALRALSEGADGIHQHIRKSDETLREVLSAVGKKVDDLHDSHLGPQARTSAGGFRWYGYEDELKRVGQNQEKLVELMTKLNESMRDIVQELRRG